MNAVAMLCIAILANVLPDHAASLLGHSRAAWAYVAQGIESATLWLLAASLLPAGSVYAAAQPVAAYGAIEGSLRAVCRASLPMDRPPKLSPGQNLCDAVFGWPVTWLSLIAALFVAILTRELHRVPHR